MYRLRVNMAAMGIVDERVDVSAASSPFVGGSWKGTTGGGGHVSIHFPPGIASRSWLT
jgi:hypothetical protein